jgi:cysteine synthase A
LRGVGAPEGVGLYAKLELWNPGGSVKDRIGVSMLEDAEKKGELRPGGAIVEATAGNTGLGIAVAALGKGYRVIFVVPTKFSAEKQSLMRALGAEVVNTPREEGMRGASRKAEELRETIPGAVSLKQFENPANPRAHYETTGPEIWRDLDGRVDCLAAGAGSGGTYSGAVKYLKERNARVRGVLADPVGSILGGGHDHADYDIEGIGNDFIPGVMDLSLVDEVVKVSDAEAFETSKLLARAEGIFAGASSGAALFAALAFARRVKAGNIVAILPDRGDRYFSRGLYD